MQVSEPRRVGVDGAGLRPINGNRVLSQRDDVLRRDRRQELPEAPNTALVERIVGSPPLFEQKAQRVNVMPCRIEPKLEQPSALGTKQRAGRRVDAALATGKSHTYFTLLDGGRVMAPSDADETSAAYFAMTPVV